MEVINRNSLTGVPSNSSNNLQEVIPNNNLKLHKLMNNKRL